MNFRAAQTITLAFVLTLSVAAHAAKKSESLAARVESTKRQIVEADVQKRQILGSIYSIQKRMKKISAEKSSLTNELFQAQDNVRSIAKIINSLETEIGRQRTQLRKRLRTLYKLSGEGYLGAIFANSNVYELDETLRFLKIVAESDYRLIQSYRQNIVTYKAHQETLKTQVQKLVGIEKKIKKQENLLADEQRSKSKIVSTLEDQKKKSIAQIKNLRERVPVDSEMAELLKPSIYERRGMLPAPVAGQVVQEFGLITDEKYKIRLSHKGQTYATETGSPVQAVFDGTVARILNLKGYGSTIVIDHGDHYYSVYSHLAKTKVKSGDTVARGTILAAASKTLYFELRHFSEPENPAAWISPNKGFPSQARAD
ncbi:MAG TPA: peptidoglycan DD-metalloendopeptidase family protein [Bdellovibrionales bacterium]|nr:peptidoglycan DD-metalloendopeptidase family protein [Bdellovibrionales bacterium]